MAKAVYSLEDAKKHVSDKDCWLVVHGENRIFMSLNTIREGGGGRRRAWLDELAAATPTPHWRCRCSLAGKVYDVTAFLEEHPGGYDVILTSSGAFGGAWGLVLADCGRTEGKASLGR